jgi:hypothetical protein
MPHATLTVDMRETDHFRRLVQFVTEVDRICLERVDTELEGALESLYRDLRRTQRC